jgi:type II secretory pathway component PulC
MSVWIDLILWNTSNSVSPSSQLCQLHFCFVALYLTSTFWCVRLLACIKCLQYYFVMSSMSLIMSSLRCCILRASVQSTSHPVNYNTQILGKYISSQVVLIIKHKNLLSQMTRGPFSLHLENIKLQLSMKMLILVSLGRENWSTVLLEEYSTMENLILGYVHPVTLIG